VTEEPSLLSTAAPAGKNDLVGEERLGNKYLLYKKKNLYNNLTEKKSARILSTPQPQQQKKI
jgi:hypothetical protein